MNSLTSRMKKYAHSLGADLVGVASVDRFDAAPEGHRPSNILPQAKSVVVCAKRIPNGSLESLGTSYQHAMNILDSQLDTIACQLAIFLEENGGLAVAVAESYYDWDAENLHGRGDLSHKHAAQAAGLGRLGKNSLLITPQFGNRVELASVVTSVELDADDMLQKDLCPTNCTLCIKACPVGAIGEGQQINQRLCRGFMIQKLPKGFEVENCRECRKVCRVGMLRNRQKIQG